MSPAETAQLIRLAGGDSEFGKMLGIDHADGFQQRVNNWKRRGLPAAVALEHYAVIQRLRKTLDSSEPRAKASA